MKKYTFGSIFLVLLSVLFTLNGVSQEQDGPTKPKDHGAPEFTTPLNKDSAVRILQDSSIFDLILPGLKVREITSDSTIDKMISTRRRNFTQSAIVHFKYEYPIKFGRKTGKGTALLKTEKNDWEIKQLKLELPLKEQTDAERIAEAKEEQAKETERLIALYRRSRSINQFLGSFPLYEKGDTSVRHVELTNANITIHFQSGKKPLKIWFGDIASLSGNYLQQQDGPNIEILWNASTGPITTVFEERGIQKDFHRASSAIRSAYQQWIARYKDVKGRIDLDKTEPAGATSPVPVPVSKAEKDESLFLAVLREDSRAALAFISAGANVNLPRSFFPFSETAIDQKDDYSLLYWACFTRQMDVIRALLEHHADPNLSMKYRPSPLAFAVENGDVQIVDLLIVAGSDVNWTDSVSKRSPLMAASYMGNPIVVKKLIESGAKIDQKDSKRQTALDYARTRKQEAESAGEDPVNFTEIVQMLEKTARTE